LGVPIHKIAVGRNHSVALAQKVEVKGLVTSKEKVGNDLFEERPQMTEVWVWGDKSCNQLGLEDPEQVDPDFDYAIKERADENLNLKP
jgi:hypothetical protein